MLGGIWRSALAEYDDFLSRKLDYYIILVVEISLAWGYLIFFFLKVFLKKIKLFVCIIMRKKVLDWIHLYWSTNVWSYNNKLLISIIFTISIIFKNNFTIWSNFYSLHGSGHTNWAEPTVCKLCLADLLYNTKLILHLYTFSSAPSDKYQWL